MSVKQLNQGAPAILLRSDLPACMEILKLDSNFSVAIVEDSELNYVLCSSKFVYKTFGADFAVKINEKLDNSKKEKEAVDMMYLDPEEVNKILTYINSPSLLLDDRCWSELGLLKFTTAENTESTFAKFMDYAFKDIGTTIEREYIFDPAHYSTIQQCSSSQNYGTTPDPGESSNDVLDWVKEVLEYTRYETPKSSTTSIDAPTTCYKPDTTKFIPRSLFPEKQDLFHHTSDRVTVPPDMDTILNPITKGKQKSSHTHPEKVNNLPKSPYFESSINTTDSGSPVDKERDALMKALEEEEPDIGSRGDIINDPKLWVHFVADYNRKTDKNRIKFKQPQHSQNQISLLVAVKMLVTIRPSILSPPRTFRLSNPTQSDQVTKVKVPALPRPPTKTQGNSTGEERESKDSLEEARLRLGQAISGFNAVTKSFNSKTRHSHQPDLFKYTPKIDIHAEKTADFNVAIHMSLAYLLRDYCHTDNEMKYIATYMTALRDTRPEWAKEANRIGELMRSTQSADDYLDDHLLQICGLHREIELLKCILGDHDIFSKHRVADVLRHLYSKLRPETLRKRVSSGMALKQMFTEFRMRVTIDRIDALYSSCLRTVKIAQAEGLCGLVSTIDLDVATLTIDIEHIKSYDMRTFDTLPGEVRNRIYSYCEGVDPDDASYPEHSPVDIIGSKPGPLGQVNSQLRKEYLSFYYNHRTFVVPLMMGEEIGGSYEIFRDWLVKSVRPYAGSVRHVKFTLWSPMSPHREESMVDS
ncbi:hypothetical protein M501DRAFT_1015129 [Patellaria atrata CBS 101060]|uniref:Uncharacterized protein n=1 Tax=Patellaria atrata CBS 101060 TaxID=1346257 RepID=A0A9P4SCG7_9PEZI|nr:hypothetical protein M501DRAFT_1015129 [Patellaria atrata CBS 101060]